MADIVEPADEGRDEAGTGLGGEDRLGGREAQSDIDHDAIVARSEAHTSELQSLMRISYAVFCLKNKRQTKRQHDAPPSTYRQHLQANQPSTTNLHYVAITT